MVRPSKTVRDQALTETRQRLLDAAAVEFANEGYVGANINRISLAAGFAKGTIYNYFDSKQALMSALVNETAAAHIKIIVERVDPETDAIQRLEQFFRAGFDFVEQHPHRSRLVITLIYGPDEAFRNQVYQSYQPLFDLLIEGIIGAGIAQGHFRPTDPNLAAGLVMTIYLGSCSLRNDAGKIWFDPAHILSFVLDGLRSGEDAGVEHEPDHVFAEG
jgi:AcrR family transcriptional regulator